MVKKLICVVLVVLSMALLLPAYAENTSLTLTAGVTATYTAALMNESSNFTFVYTAEGEADSEATLTFSVNGVTATKTLSIPATNSSSRVSFSEPLSKGTYTFSVTSSVDMTMSNIEFKYKDTSTPITDIYFTDLTENEEAVHTAVLVNKNASCIIVNGAKRYIDYEDTAVKPLLSEGRLCLPARVLALSLGYYFENNTDKNYLLLRNTETGMGYYFTSGASYKQLYNGAKEEIDFVPFYKNGEAYLPVRYFAEAIGKTVLYQDGIAVIDEKEYAENIINATAVFEYVKELFADYTEAPQIGTTYHVAKSGNDKNDGKTAATAFATLAKAGQTAAAGDTVIIHEGTYREVLAPANNGTAVSPIVFKAAENESVVISALEEISGFSAYDNTLITAALPVDLGVGRNQMFINRNGSVECLVEARYPNSPGIASSEYGGELSKLFPVLGDFEVSGKKADGTDVATSSEAVVVTSDTLLNEGTDWSGGAFVSAHGNAYTLCIAEIERSEAGKLYLKNLPKKWWWNPRFANWLDFGYITGHRNAIDLPGEWVVENGKIVMLAPEGYTKDTLTVEMKQRQLVIDIADRSYIKISGINTIGGGVKMNDSVSCVLDGMNMSYISHYTYSDDQRSGFIDDYSAYNKPALSADSAPERGEVGIYIGGSDNAVINSVIDHSAGAGIYMTGVYGYIDNNTISNCGYMGSYVSGITVMNRPTQSFGDKRGGFALYNNTIMNTGRSLINIQGLEGYPQAEGAASGVSYIAYLPFDIAYNDLHDGTMFSADTGAFYHYQDNCATERARSKFRNNYIYYTRAEQPRDATAIYNDGYSNGVDCFNNIVFGTAEGGGYATCDYRDAVSSTCGLYRNQLIYSAVPEGPLGLTASQFPLGQPFYAGTLAAGDEYMRNYSREDEEVLYIPVSEATLSSAALSDGKVTVDNADAVLSFSNINLGSKTYNKLTLLYEGSVYYRRGDGVLNCSFADTGEQFELLMDSYSYDSEGVDSLSVDMLPKTGSCGLTITVPQFVNPFKIRGILFSSDGENVAGGHDGSRIAAGDYDALYTLNHDGETYTQRGVYHGAEGLTIGDDGLTNGERGLTEHYGERYVKNCINGTTLLYRNVTIDEAAGVFNIQMSVTEENANRRVEIRLNSPDAEPVFSGDFGCNGRANYAETSYALPQAIAAGTYDVYVTFSRSYTSHLLSFGFASANE